MRRNDNKNKHRGKIMKIKVWKYNNRETVEGMKRQIGRASCRERVLMSG